MAVILGEEEMEPEKNPLYPGSMPNLGWRKEKLESPYFPQTPGQRSLQPYSSHHDGHLRRCAAS